MRSMASSSDYWRRRALADEEKAQQVAGRMLREQRKVYRQAYADIERALDALYTQAVDQGAESLTRTQLWQYSKYKQLKAVLQEQTGEIAKGQITAIESTLERIFKDTIGSASKAFAGKDIRFNGVSDGQVKRLIKSNWSGESFSKRVWRNTREIARRVEKDVTDMMVLGKSPSAVKQQLMHDYNVGFRAADRLVRTEASHAYNSAALESYKAAGVTQVEVLIGKDDRLCDECAGIAGVYDIDKVPRLPVHPHCRCTYAPVVDLEAEIKAIEAKKAAKKGIIEMYRASTPVIGGAKNVQPQTIVRLREARGKILDDFPTLDALTREWSFEKLEDGTLAANRFRINAQTGEVVSTMAFDVGAFGDEEAILQMLADDYGNGLSFETKAVESLLAHEIGHAAHNALALKRAGYVEGRPLTSQQIEAFLVQREQIGQEVYLVAFTNESYYEIVDKVTQELGTMAIKPEELIAQSFGSRFYGVQSSHIARVITEFFKRELE